MDAEKDSTVTTLPIPVRLRTRELYPLNTDLKEFMLVPKRTRTVMKNVIIQKYFNTFVYQ